MQLKLFFAKKLILSQEKKRNSSNCRKKRGKYINER